MGKYGCSFNMQMSGMCKYANALRFNNTNNQSNKLWVFLNSQPCHCEERSNRELCKTNLPPCDCFVPRNDK